VKILVLTWEYPPRLTGGLGRHVAELAPALAEQGVTVHVVTPCPEPALPLEEVSPNLMIHRVDTVGVDIRTDIYAQAQQTNPLLTQAVDRLWTAVEGFDLIHVHDWLVSFAALTLKMRYKCPVVATIHATETGRWRSDILSNPLSQAIDRAERELMFEAWRIIACSHYMIRELQAGFRLPDDKLDMIPNGVRLWPNSEFKAEDLAEFRKKFVEPDDPLIFSVGRLVYEKGQHVLLGAMPKILATFPRAKLVLAGRGPLLGYLQQIVDSMGIQKNVQFVGFVSDTERNNFFTVADCAVFPSLYEPFGIVALEAMAFNCPVVASNNGGLTEVVDHEKTGLLTYTDNSDSAAWGVLEILKKPLLAKQYVANARRIVAEKYNWAYVAGETKKVYQRVLKERAETKW